MATTVQNNMAPTVQSSKEVVNRDLSHVRTLKDLREEILKVKIRVRTQEQYLKEQRKNLAPEALRLALNKVLPIFLTRGVVVKTIGIVKNAVGLYSRMLGAGKANLKQGVVNSIKKFGVVTALKAAFNLYKNRKKH